MNLNKRDVLELGLSFVFGGVVGAGIRLMGLYLDRRIGAPLSVQTDFIPMDRCLLSHLSELERRGVKKVDNDQWLKLVGNADLLVKMVYELSHNVRVAEKKDEEKAAGWLTTIREILRDLESKKDEQISWSKHEQVREFLDFQKLTTAVSEQLGKHFTCVELLLRKRFGASMDPPLSAAVPKGASAGGKPPPP